MTTDEFFDALTACASRYTWRIEEDSLSLRGYVYSSATGLGDLYCPITAMVHAQNGGDWTVAEWDVAAQAVALPLDAASAIVGAADDDGSDMDGALRARLLAAVGL